MKERIYEIDCSGQMLIGIKVKEDGTIEVIGACNAGGYPVDCKVKEVKL